MNNQIAKSSKDFFAMPNVKAKLTELLGKNAASFATSVLQIVLFTKEKSILRIIAFSKYGGGI